MRRWISVIALSAWALSFTSVFSAGPALSAGSDPTSGVLPSYDDAYANWKNAGLHVASAAFRTGRRFARRSIRSAEDRTTSPTSRTRSTIVRQARSFSLERAHLPFIWPICPSRFRRGSRCAGRATAAAPARRTARPPSPCLMALSPIQAESAARVRLLKLPARMAGRR